MLSAKARDFQKIATSLGFLLKRTSGSHRHWEHADGGVLTIPVHGGKEIGPPLFYKILGQLGITLWQFKGFTEKISQTEWLKSNE